jgi:hypothetical protein
LRISGSASLQRARNSWWAVLAFERNGTTEPYVLSLIDHAHPAAELLEDSVVEMV